MPDQTQKDILLAQHVTLIERTRRIAAIGDIERATGATRVRNQLAEAFAWLAGAPTPTALVDAESLLAQAEEHLRRLED